MYEKDSMKMKYKTGMKRRYGNNPKKYSENKQMQRNKLGQYFTLDMKKYEKV